MPRICQTEAAGTGFTAFTAFRRPRPQTCRSSPSIFGPEMPCTSWTSRPGLHYSFSTGGKACLFSFDRRFSSEPTMSGTHRWWIDMKTVEYWMWRYRNVETGRICRTMFPCSADEASRLYPDAKRIEGTMILREVDDDEAVGTRRAAFRRKVFG